MIPALAIAAALALGADPPPKAPPPPAREEAAKRNAPPSADDAEVMANLELLEKLELLRDLPIVDAGGKDGKDDGDPEEK